MTCLVNPSPRAGELIQWFPVPSGGMGIDLRAERVATLPLCSQIIKKLKKHHIFEKIDQIIKKRHIIGENRQSKKNILISQN